jgi:hypothetical protein
MSDLWRGRQLDEMSRAELIDVIREMGERERQLIAAHESERAMMQRLRNARVVA